MSLPQRLGRASRRGSGRRPSLHWGGGLFLGIRVELQAQQGQATMEDRVQEREMGGWRRKRGREREGASVQVRHRFLSCGAPCFPLSDKSESTFLALRLSYLDPSLFLVPGTVSLAICCSDGPFQGVPLLTSSSPAVRAASSKGKTPWEGECLPSN